MLLISLSCALCVFLSTCVQKLSVTNSKIASYIMSQYIFPENGSSWAFNLLQKFNAISETYSTFSIF